MRPHEALSHALKQADGSALVAFLTAGYPEPERFLQILGEIENVADAVEIGVPFTDPMADGVTIQRSSQAAIEKGISLRWILDQLAARKTKPVAPILLMSYLNPLLAFDFDKLAARANEAHVSGFIVPDLPYEESAPLKDCLDTHGLALVQLVTPATPSERLIQLCKVSQGFVYAVSRTVITGVEAGLPIELAEYLGAVKAAAQVPVCAGFGVREREQVKLINQYTDGVIVGSALVEALERGESAAAFLKALRL